MTHNKHYNIILDISNHQVGQINNRNKAKSMISNLVYLLLNKAFLMDLENKQSELKHLSKLF